jgi:hypothetical protein
MTISRTEPEIHVRSQPFDFSHKEFGCDSNASLTMPSAGRSSVGYEVKVVVVITLRRRVRPVNKNIQAQK